MTEFLDLCRATVGDRQVLTGDAMSGYLTDQRGRFTGRALAVVRPASTEEVAAIVRLCKRFRTPIVPQGGNTGLVQGSVPDGSGTAILMSLNRLNRIRHADPVNNTLIAEAGCVLQTVHDAATSVDRHYPLRLASEGSCTVGGMLAANAGGTAVLRYGNARELCLGLEVVTADGEIWNGLRELRKDNSAYDLRDLFIGSEGTLGIITAAVLKLFPAPKASLTALLAVDSPADALTLLTIAQRHCGATLTGFELMSRFSLQLVAKHYPQFSSPIPLRHAQYVLIELSDSESEAHAMTLLERVSEDGMTAGIMLDAVLALSIAQSRAVWQMREHISLAQALEGNNVKHDISLPPSRIAEFLAETDALLQQQFPGCRNVTFGHVGDGNLHYNVSAPEGVPPEEFLLRQTEIHRTVHDQVHRHGGSIAAEHGVGTLKRDEIVRYLPAVEIRMMKAVKQALDPDNLMNPGKIL